jgi:hypothetical protein
MVEALPSLPAVKLQLVPSATQLMYAMQSFKQVMTSVLVVVFELFMLELLVDVLDMFVLLVEMLDIEVLLREVLVVGAGAGQRCAGSTCAGAVG